MDFFAKPQKRSFQRLEETPNDNSDAQISGDTSGEEISLSESEPSSEDEQLDETQADKRRRLAKEYLSRVEAEVEGEMVDGFDAKDLDEDIINSRLRQEAEIGGGAIVHDLSNITIEQIQKKRVKQSKLTCITADEKFIYAGSKCGLICRYSISPFQIAAQHRLDASATCIAVSPNSQYVVVGTTSKIIVLHAQQLTVAHEFPLRCAVNSLCIRPPNDLYVACADLKLRTYDLSTLSFVETLHGHQDSIMDIHTLTQERCVSVGGRDRTAIFWKIPEESRLTLRGGDPPSNKTEDCLEGSIDCCCMLDNQYFVTGSDNGNLRLFSTGRKKAVYTEKLAHSLAPALPANRASAEIDPSKAEIPPAQPRPITTISAIPQSNVFVSCSVGEVKFWLLAEDKRSFKLLHTISLGREYVTGVVCKQNYVFATLSREPKFGRWQVVSGHDKVAILKLQ